MWINIISIGMGLFYSHQYGAHKLTIKISGQETKMKRKLLVIPFSSLSTDLWSGRESKEVELMDSEGSGALRKGWDDRDRKKLHQVNNSNLWNPQKDKHMPKSFYATFFPLQYEKKKEKKKVKNEKHWIIYQ